MKIIDSHQHFWQIARGDYDWLTADLGVLYRDYLPEELAPILNNLGIEKTILVQAAATVTETDYMLNLADQYDFIGGVVGWVDFESDTAIQDIQRLSKNPKFKGLRPMLQDLEDPNWIAKPVLKPVIEAMVDQGLRFDALVFTAHIDALIKMMTQHPDLPVVIDHGAKPPIASGDLSLWKEKIAQLASNKAIYCKLSGLLTECSATQDIDSIRPAFDHLLNCFGSERLMWGSDWPVLKLREEYPNWLSIAQNLIEELPVEDQKNIMSRNATLFYGLDSTG